MDLSDQLKKFSLSAEFVTLFSSIKGVLFFVKNLDCVIIGGNQLIAEHLGFDKLKDYYGKTDFEIFPRELAERYYKDDLEVLKTQKPKTNIVELFPNYLGDLAWFNTSKIPLFDHNGKIAGLCGIAQTYELSNNLSRPFREISPGLEFLKTNIYGKVTNSQLAQACGLTVRQFEKRFKEIFKTTPYKYIIKMKILKACELLIDEDMTIADVAMEMGFCDQSSLTFHFKKETSLTPLQYIKKHQA